MKLSTRAEYGIRALIELALQFQHAPDKPLMLQVIAGRQDISKKYLEQLFIPLRKAGVVEGVRGPSGGYRLARAPEEIHLDQVFEVLEGSLSVADCLDTPNSCKHSGGCATQEVWRQISQAIESTLGAISLADLLERHSCLVQRLQALSAVGPGQSLDCAEAQ
ncbi:MAG: Rrf2 family transcriptional regulator [Deltaproteobacteria bacterium]|nr:MAG: Rrf2 family transcriptional regulator [Deltaproteobacteria bacterium]